MGESSDSGSSCSILLETGYISQNDEYNSKTVDDDSKSKLMNIQTDEMSKNDEKKSNSKTESKSKSKVHSKKPHKDGSISKVSKMGGGVSRNVSINRGDKSKNISINKGSSKNVNDGS